MDSEAISRLHRELATAVITFHEAAARRLGMTAAERKCAGLIAELGSVTPKHLATMTGLSTGAITGIVDRLERAGYAAREPNPSDRRSTVVRPRNLERLKRESEPIFAALTAAMTALIDRYSESERALLRRHLQDVTGVLREQSARLQERG